MKKVEHTQKYRHHHIWLLAGILLLTAGAGALRANPAYVMADFESIPVAISEDSGGKPQVQINASNDHQLFFKAYNDYGDLDDDGIPESTYKHSVDYYGYFDPYKCYKYDSTDERFEPQSLTVDKYCTVGSDEWSGNFLNWVSMTRIDAIRKILFGGHRRVDTKDDTVLERAFLPPDIHSFAKFYNRTDLPKLTPFHTSASAVTGNSNSSVEIGFGSKVFTLTNPSTWNRVGDYVEAVDTADSDNFVSGKILKIDTATGEVTVNVTSTGGSGTISSWTFSNKTIQPNTEKSATSITIGTGTKTFVIDINGDEANNSPEQWNIVGDYVEIVSRADTSNYMRGWVTAIDDATERLEVKIVVTGGSGTFIDWNITNLTRPGATFCNVTYASGTIFSEEVTDPPLIRVADGNYTFWSAGEVHQCLWEDEDPGGNGKNYNNPEYTNIFAQQDNPYKTEGLGEKDYVARVQACVDLNSDGKYDATDGTETCKQYPNGNFKPIGLLQEYGDNDDILFGMIAGTFGKSTSGGDMIMPLFNNDNKGNNMCREINLGRDCNDDGSVDDLVLDTDHAEGDGTFKHVYTWVGGQASKQDAEGVINSWSIYRIKGYKYGGWTYADNSGDKCPLSIKFFGDSSSSECQNWGNPFAEIYLTALRHWAGLNAPQDFQASDNDKGVFQGLNYLNGVWTDPLTDDNYCVPLSVINFNSSVISTDTAFTKQEEELDTSNHGIVKDLDAPDTAVDRTNELGHAEGIDDPTKTWYIGETSADGSRTCSAKTIDNLGEVRGVCPEGPGLAGGYLIAGMAWYAHTNDIRPDSLTGNRGLQGKQTVDNYSVRLASGNPIMEIPVPGSDKTVTIIPSCITNNKDNYGCSLVDFKIITPHYEEEVGGVATGKGTFFAIWEDSLQGNDYDLDAGGIYTYEITSAEIKITTAVTLENLGYAIGHGYVISGTTQDGLHIHSGTNSFDYTDPTGANSCSNCFGLADGGSASTNTYTLGDSAGQQLEDPLWYAAKWGGFDDKNGNDQPDLEEEWDAKNNKTGEDGPDGIPDTYYFASHPQELVDSLRAAFNAILERTSSGTAAAVVSSNVRGEGALYQAFYEPLKKNDGKEAQWIGTLQALWLDSYGYNRQDCGGNYGYDPATDTCEVPGPGDICTPNGILDNYCIDQVVETYYDEDEGRARARVYNSNSPDEFTAYSMQGVVSSYTSPDVEMVPNSLQGVVTYNATDSKVTMSPYYLEGTVDAYDDITGEVTMTIVDSGGPSGDTADEWEVEDTTSLISGRSSSTITFGSGSLTFEVTPVGSWISVGDTLRLSTKKVVGKLGEIFDDWDAVCLEGVSATGKVVNIPITLANEGDDTFAVVGDDFASCTLIQLSSYDLVGEEGDSYDSWQVTNLDTILGRGTSDSDITLANSGTIAFTVSPVDNWLAPGDRVSVSNYTFTTVELNELSYLWNAREELYLDGVSDVALASNRLYSGSTADNGRYIYTWVDTDLDGELDPFEYQPFIEDMLVKATDPVPYGFFDVADQAEAEDVINYIRGIEVTGTRNRTIKYATSDATEHVMRLGDIIDSTPTVVAAPQEGFNLLYKDDSYKEFRSQYQNRRVMVYAGANDGLFHAFNGGFYDVVEINGKDTVQYSTSGFDHGVDPPVAAAAHPLGSEIWAYAPYNLLGHLQWLKDPDYALSHVYYLNAKPRVFDANIFNPDSSHPNGWGTVLVVGMQIGGGPMEVDTNSDDGLGNTTDNVTLRSAYLVFDITNPEDPPQLLGELTLPDGSYTTVYPAVIAFRDAVQDSSGTACTDVGANCINKWYLVFGNGPDNFVDFSSSQNGTAYFFDLSQLTTAATAVPDLTDTVPAGCAIQAYTASGSMNIIVCDTGVVNSFMGTPMVVDWNLDFYADTAYWGLVGDADADSGELWRMALSDWDDTTHDDWETGNWFAPDLFYQPNQPVYAQPVPAFDEKGNKWIFFGTGRYFANADKTSTPLQSLYGIKDDDSGLAVSSATLLDVTDTEVYTDKSVTDPPTSISGNTLTDFDDIEDEIDNYAGGWMLDLPLIVGTAGTDPSTRNFTRSALLGGVLFSSVFQPSEDPCVGEGLSRLYGLYYKTGTAYPGPAILGTDVETVDGEVKYRSLRYLDLGSGVATAPAIHSGSGSGGFEVSAFTQLSTGTIERETGSVIESVRTGKTSWSDRH